MIPARGRVNVTPAGAGHHLPSGSKDDTPRPAPFRGAVALPGRGRHDITNPTHLPQGEA